MLHSILWCRVDWVGAAVGKKDLFFRSPTRSGSRLSTSSLFRRLGHCRTTRLRQRTYVSCRWSAQGGPRRCCGNGMGWDLALAGLPSRLASAFDNVAPSAAACGCKHSSAPGGVGGAAEMEWGGDLVVYTLRRLAGAGAGLGNSSPSSCSSVMQTLPPALRSYRT